MKIELAGTTIELVTGDITEEDTDAIVNAANSGLAGGGGVDGAIHKAGGPSIMEECADFEGCPTGSAVITGAGKMNARHVIHTVGPVYRGGGRGEEGQLGSAYSASLTLAVDSGLKSVSFPSISTGAYGYPVEEAARVALTTVIDFIKGNDGLDLVRFVLFSEHDLSCYVLELEELTR